MRPSRQAMQHLLERCGILLAPAQVDQLWTYHQMLRAANAELNLTRIHNFENIVLKHYVDSLIILKLTELPTPLVDMGSGAGLPGIPLKIARPEIEMILAEPRGARAEFLRNVCGELKLGGIEVHAGKIGPGYTRRVAGVITRAVTTVWETLDRVEGCLGAGGRVLFMKGPACDAEVAAAAESHVSRFRLVADHAYQLPHSTHARRLLIYERLDYAAPSTADLSGGAERQQPFREISSAANPAFKLASELLHGRGIRKHGRALLAGPKITAEVFDRYPEYAESWLTDTQSRPAGDGSRDATRWLRLSDALFRQLDVSGTQAPLLQVRLPDIAAWSDDDAWPEGCTLFLPFQDPENIGAAIRSAAAFQVARVVLLREAAHPFLPKSARAAGPSLFKVPLLTGPSIGELSARRVPLLALTPGAEPVDMYRWPDTFGLIAGLEGPGLPSSLSGARMLSIPIAPDVESLNAATATSIALYAWRRSMG
jgi:16S rRNA (guanine527-N7)-methyltransferase